MTEPTGTSADYGDEPQTSGAIVAVHYGDYRQQEIWVRSGTNIGNWYCLGGEFGRPKPWDDPRSFTERIGRWGPGPEPPPGHVRRHPTWEDILKRGPVTVLTATDQESYRNGWRNGRRRMTEQIEQVADDDE